MSEFEKWIIEYRKDKNRSDSDWYPNQVQIFEAGAQSKQAEIDDLQKRIDEAIDYLHDGNQRELSYEYADAINDVIDILKGTTNEQ